MAYRMPRPGHLEVHSGQRGFAAFVWAAFGLLLVGHMTMTVFESGWSNDLLGGVFGIALLAGLGLLVFRNDSWQVTPHGVQLAGEKQPRADVVVDRLRLEVELHTSANNTGTAGRQVVYYAIEAMVHEQGRGHAIEIDSFRSEAKARQAAEAIALHMGWPLEDAIGDREEIRTPDEMNRLAEHKPAPTEPPPAGLRVEARRGQEVLIVEGLFQQRQRKMLPIVGVGMFTTSVITAALLWSTLGEAAPLAVGLVLLCDVIGFAALVAAWHVEAELSVEHGVVRRRLHVGPVHVQTKAMDLREVERVRVQTKERLARGCVLVSDDATLRVGQALEKPALLWLQAWLESRIP